MCTLVEFAKKNSSDLGRKGAQVPKTPLDPPLASTVPNSGGYPMPVVGNEESDDPKLPHAQCPCTYKSVATYMCAAARLLL